MARSDDLTDAKLATVSAETDTKIARLEGKIDTLAAVLSGKMDALREDISNSDKYNRDSRLMIMGSLIAGVIALGALFVAVATYGDAVFSRGMSVREVIQNTIKDYEGQKAKK